MCFNSSTVLSARISYPCFPSYCFFQKSSSYIAPYSCWICIFVSYSTAFIQFRYSSLLITCSATVRSNWFAFLYWMIPATVPVTAIANRMIPSFRNCFFRFFIDSAPFHINFIIAIWFFFGSFFLVDFHAIFV